MRVIAQSKEQPGVFVIGEGPEPRLGDYLWDSKLNKPASQARAYTYVPAFLPPSIERAILVSFTAYLRGESHAASTDAGPRKHHDGRRANAVRDQDRAVVDGGNAGARPRVDPGSPVVRVSQGASVPEARVQSVKGDLPGHEFHGNQYVEGEGGGKERTDEGRGPTLASLNAQADQIIAGLPPKARHVIARDNAVRFLGEKGGFTYDLRGKVPKGGQAISPYKDREHKVDNLTREELMKYEYANRDLLSKPNHYVGGWLNPTDNKVYLDVSIVVHDRKVAEKLATEHGQLAYYDLGSGQTYTVGKADEGTKFVLHALLSKRWAFMKRERKDFNPDQARDETGKWTDGGNTTGERRATADAAIEKFEAVKMPGKQGMSAAKAESSLAELGQFRNASGNKAKLTLEGMEKNVEKYLDSASEAQVAAGQKWYGEAHDYSEGLREKYPSLKLTEAQASMALAACSANQAWDDNYGTPRAIAYSNQTVVEGILEKAEANPVISVGMKEVDDFINFQKKENPGQEVIDLRKANVGGIVRDFTKGEHRLLDLPPKAAWLLGDIKSLPSHAMPVLKMLQGDSVDVALGGNKIRSFYANIMSAGSDVKDRNVTVDLWQVRVALNNPDIKSKYYGKYSSTPAKYNLLAQALRNVADRRGMTPRTLQAITWTSFRTKVDVEKDFEAALKESAKRAKASAQGSLFKSADPETDDEFVDGMKAIYLRNEIRGTDFLADYFQEGSSAVEQTLDKRQAEGATPSPPTKRKLAPIPPGRKFVVHVSPLSITNGQASLVDKGESEGHPFRGNQYTEGQGGGAEPPSRDEAVAARVAANDLKAKYGEAAKARIAARQHMDERIIDMQNEAIKNALTRKDEYGNTEYQIAGKWLQGWEVYGAMNAAEDSEYMARKADYDAKIEASDKAERDFEEADTKAKESERLYARGVPGRIELEKHLSSTPVSHTNRLGGGVSETLLLTFSDGSKAVFKPEEGEPEAMRSAIEHGYQTEREVGAWEVAKLVGLTDLVAPTVERTLRGQRGSLQEFKEGEVAGDLDSADRYDGHENAIRAAVFDYVIGNQDRHAGNWLVEGDDSLHLIDHGLSFPSVKDHRAQGNMDFEDWAQDIKSIPKATLTRYGRAYVDNLDKIEAKLTDLGLPRNSIQALRMRVEDLREE